MKPDNSAAPSAREPELPALDWLRHARAEQELLRDVELKLGRKRRRRLAGGAAFVCIVALTLGVVAPRLGRPAAPDRGPLAQHAATAAPASTTAARPSATVTVSRPERRTLPDGSTVELNAGAEIVVAFSDASRRITLVRGEAHFAVAQNPLRPFVVQAGRVEVRAVGTAFAVQLASSNVDVLVTEGRVKVTSAPVAHASPGTSGAAAEPPHALVDAGGRCVVDVDAGTAPRVVPAPPAQAAAQLAWRVPQLEFSRTPLHEVLTLVNDHAAATGAPTYEIADSALRDIKLTGLLRADNTAGLERLLETSFDIRLSRSAGKILLHRP